MRNRKAKGTKTRREMIRAKHRREQQRRRLVLIAIIAGAALLVAAVLIYPSFRPIGEIVQPIGRDHPQADGVALGDPSAPVILEEFSDFQCSACRIWYENNEPAIIENYVKTGKVYFVYRQFPFIGSESFQAANASMCASEQGRFWDYHDLLFANQTGENIGAFSNRRLVAFAESLELDMDGFNSCFNSNRYRDDINQDLNKGRNGGVRGTPSIMLNGALIESASLPSLQQQIDALVAASQ